MSRILPGLVFVAFLKSLVFNRQTKGGILSLLSSLLLNFNENCCPQDVFNSVRKLVELRTRCTKQRRCPLDVLRFVIRLADTNSETVTKSTTSDGVIAPVNTLLS